MINIADFRLSAGIFSGEVRLRYSIIGDSYFFAFTNIHDAEAFKGFSHVNNFLISNKAIGLSYKKVSFMFSKNDLLGNSRLFSLNFNQYVRLNFKYHEHDDSLSFEELVHFRMLELL